MSNNPKSGNTLKYRTDLSTEKYESRYDRLLNILFYAKELPIDLHTQMNLSYDNFRKAISILKQRGQIKKISYDGLHSYILTPDGKHLTRQLNYMKYRSCLEDDRRQYDTKHRSRKWQFAYLYALLDRVGIPYEDFAKPQLNRLTVTGDTVCFYTALDFKRMLGIEATPFKGSRLLGFFIGRGQIFPVYRTNYQLKSFGRNETLVPEFVKRFFAVSVSTAILICSKWYSVVHITEQIIKNNDYQTKGAIHTAPYKNFCILPSDDTFFDRFEDLYVDHSERKQSIIRRYHIDTSATDRRGRYRFNYGTGFIADRAVLVCAGNVNTVTLKRFILNAERAETESLIFCEQRDSEILKEITRDMPICVVTI